MDLVYINNDYIDFIIKNNKLFNVLENKYNPSTGTSRPYIGVLFKRNGLDYCIPLTTKNQSKSKTDIQVYKHVKSSSHIDYRFLRVGQAIPIPRECYIKINIANYSDVNDRIALYETFKKCKEPDTFKAINRLFEKIYIAKTGINPNNISIQANIKSLYQQMSVDFLEAEKECLNYITLHNLKNPTIKPSANYVAPLTRDEIIKTDYKALKEQSYKALDEKIYNQEEVKGHELYSVKGDKYVVDSYNTEVKSLTIVKTDTFDIIRTKYEPTNENTINNTQEIENSR